MGMEGQGRNGRGRGGRKGEKVEERGGKRGMVVEPTKFGRKSTPIACDYNLQRRLQQCSTRSMHVFDVFQ